LYTDEQNQKGSGNCKHKPNLRRTFLEHQTKYRPHNPRDSNPDYDIHN